MGGKIRVSSAVGVYTAPYTDPRDEVFASSLGADQFIVKPMDPIALREQIRGVVQRQRSGVLNRGALASSDENLASTGYSDQIATTHLLEHGFSAVLGKPFLMHELLATVATLIPSRSATASRSPAPSRSSS